MGQLYQCDGCEVTAPAREGVGSYNQPENWVTVGVTVRQYGGKARYQAPPAKLLCFKCAAKYGVTEQQMEEISNNPADYLMGVIENMVYEAVENSHN